MKDLPTLTIVLPHYYNHQAEMFVNISTKGIGVELVVNNIGPDFKLNKNIKVTCLDYKNKSDYLNYSTITAMGKWISLLFDDNDISNIDSIISMAKKLEFANVVVGNNSHGVKNKLGIRDISKTKPVIFSRDYLATQLPFDSSFLDKKSVLNIIKHCDKYSGLQLRNDYCGKYYYFGKKVLFVRPNLKISLKKLSNLKSSISKKTPKDEFDVGFDSSRKIKCTKDIPIFINCRDRYKPLVKLVEWIEKEGLTNIILIDNASTYPLLLDYYKKTKHTVIHLNQNMGHRAPWTSGIINVYSSDKPYIVTDPDIIPLDGSHGAVKKFVDLLNRYRDYCKVGFGLRIDNIPNKYELRDGVINWESQFWENPIEKDLYIADIDTTFALYRPGVTYRIRPALRTGGKYIAEHEPWYIDSKNPDSEVLYYRKHARKEINSWGIKTRDIKPVYKNKNSLV